MTVDAAIVTAFTGYVLDTDFTQTQLDVWRPKAEARFAEEDPGLDSELADEAVAYLIGHRIARIKTKGKDKVSEDFGNYRYKLHDGKPGQTGWLAEYYGLLESVKSNPSPTFGGVRVHDGHRYNRYRLSKNTPYQHH